jgi:hypothetical protein
VRQLLEKRSEAEKERLQEKMLDAFDKQVDYEKGIPKGVSHNRLMGGPVIADIGKNILHVMGGEAPKRELGMRDYAAAFSIFAATQVYLETPTETEESKLLGTAKHISDIVKGNLTPIRIRKSASEKWQPYRDLRTFDKGGFFKRDSRDGRYAIFTPNDSTEEVRVPVKMIDIPKHLGKKGFNRSLDSVGYRVDELKLNNGEVQGSTPQRKGRSTNLQGVLTSADRSRGRSSRNDNRSQAQGQHER